jgi:uncharacterized protein (DUF433 family)
LESANMENYVEERDGGWYIAGTRIALASIVQAFQTGESPDEILRSFPAAGRLVKIYGAITFYLENREKVEAYLKEQDRRWEEIAQRQAESPSLLAKRLREAKEHSAIGPR